MRTLVSALFVVAIAACGGGGGTGNVDAPNGDGRATGNHDAAVDAQPTHDSAIDAPPATVIAVACGSASPVATVTDPNFTYVSTPAGSATNDSAIMINDVVEFNLVPAMNHPVVPDHAAGMTDSGLHAADGQVTCLQFTAPGTFHYECGVHLFKGTVTVSGVQ